MNAMRNFEKIYLTRGKSIEKPLQVFKSKGIVKFKATESSDIFI